MSQLTLGREQRSRENRREPRPQWLKVEGARGSRRWRLRPNDKELAMGRFGGGIPGLGPRGVEWHHWGTQNAQESHSPGPEGHGNQGCFQEDPPPCVGLCGGG